MCLFRQGDRVRVTPKDPIGVEIWGKALGGLDRTFSVLSQVGVDTVFVKSKGGERVEVPYALVKKV